jgi:hypothetical protein
MSNQQGVYSDFVNDEVLFDMNDIEFFFQVLAIIFLH